MADASLTAVLTYILQRMQEEGAAISTIRVVKMLYLADVEHVRAFGKPLSGVTWVFHHFGPYSVEAARALGSLGLDVEEKLVKTQAGHVVRRSA